MTVTEALNVVKGITGHGDGAGVGNDTQLGADGFLITVLDQTLKQLRREVVMEVPEYYTATVQTTITVGNYSYSGLSATPDFERLQRVERSDDGGATFWPVPTAPEPNSDQPDRLCWREQTAGVVIFSPRIQAPGLYLFTYVTRQTPDPVVGATVIGLPPGFEMPLIHMVAGQVRGPRLSEDEATFHLGLASKMLYGDPQNPKDKGQFAQLKKRYGLHPQQGFRASRWAQ